MLSQAILRSRCSAIDVNGGTVHPVRLKRGLVWGEIPMYGVEGAAAAAPALQDRVRRGQDRD